MLNPPKNKQEEIGAIRIKKNGTWIYTVTDFPLEHLCHYSLKSQVRRLLQYQKQDLVIHSCSSRNNGL